MTKMMTNQYVHFIHLRDVCEAVHQVISKGIVGEIYNVLDDSNIRRKDFYQFLSDLYHIPVKDEGAPIEALPDRKISNQKLKTQLGISFKYPKITDFLRTVEKA